ncbi:hypothetical protein TWF481_007695 [Arthrobotrys musiformis]|uniref:Uncharacterized protein n=1 Tax=Arthrobotrys musiformis TaxID=47236 RepID=A0AAV9WC84_9PEZI
MVLDRILRYFISVGYEFSTEQPSLIGSLLFGSSENAKTIFYNEIDYIPVDSSSIEIFLSLLTKPNNIKDGKIAGAPEKLGILLKKLGKAVEDGDCEITDPCFEGLLRSNGAIPSGDLVDSLVMLLNARANLYDDSPGGSYTYGLGLDTPIRRMFCAEAHFYGTEKEWYTALVKCRYQYDVQQVFSWEGKMLGFSPQEYYAFCEGVAGVDLGCVELFLTYQTGRKELKDLIDKKAQEVLREEHGRIPEEWI